MLIFINEILKFTTNICTMIMIVILWVNKRWRYHIFYHNTLELPLKLISGCEIWVCVLFKTQDSTFQLPSKIACPKKNYCVLHIFLIKWINYDICCHCGLPNLFKWSKIEQNYSYNTKRNIILKLTNFIWTLFTRIL